MKAVLFDLDGVLYEGENPIPGAVEAVQWFRDRQVPYLFITNTSSRPRSALVEKLANMGLQVDIDHIHMPPAAAAEWLAERGIQKVALLIRPATREEFSQFDIADLEQSESVEAVVVGDLGEAWDFNTLNAGFRFLMKEPKPVLVALGMTRFWKGPQGLQLDAAPFVVALEHASGTRARVLGKPAPAFFESALHRLGVPARQTLMVGDDIQSDIGGAQDCGIRGVLVRTGKFQPADLNREDVVPYDVVSSIADLPGWWQRKGAEARSKN